MFEKHLWKSDIFSKDASHRPASLLKTSLFHRYFSNILLVKTNCLVSTSVECWSKMCSEWLYEVRNMWLPKLDILSELVWDCSDVLLMYWCLIYHYIYHDITTIYVMLNIKGIRGSWLYSSLSWFCFFGILHGKMFQFVKFSFWIISFSSLPRAANIFLFKVNYRNTWKTCSIC